MWTIRTIGFWAATALASVAVLLVIVNGWLVTSNQAIRREVNDRQTYINQSIQLTQVEQELLKELGALVLKNNNAGIRQILAESGFTVVNQGAAAAGQAAPTAAGQAAPTPANPAAPVPLKKP